MREEDEGGGGRRGREEGEGGGREEGERRGREERGRRGWKIVRTENYSWNPYTAIRWSIVQLNRGPYYNQSQLISKPVPTATRPQNTETTRLP